MSTQRPIMNILFRTSHDAETKCNVTRLKSLTDSYLRSSYFANPYNGSYSLPNYIPIPELSRLEADIITRAVFRAWKMTSISTIIFKVLTRSLESTLPELTDLTGWLGSIYSGPEGD